MWPVTADSAPRRRALVTILEEGPPKSQRELARLLNQAGWESTQATVSRDLRQIGATRHRNGWTLPGPADDSPRRLAELHKAVEEWCIDYSVAGNLVILRTNPGAAQHVAARIDVAHLDGLLGSVGGDDTILLITAVPGQKVAASARQLLAQLGLPADD